MKTLIRFLLNIYKGRIPFETAGDVWDFAEKLAPIFFSLRLNKVKWEVPDKGIQDKLDYFYQLSRRFPAKDFKFISEDWETPPAIRLAQIYIYMLPIAVFFSYCKFESNIDFLEEKIDYIVSYLMGKHVQWEFPLPPSNLTNMEFPPPMHIPELEMRWKITQWHAR